MEFDDFVRNHLSGLVAFTTAMCADRGLAEEVVQEVLTRLHGRWDRVSQADAPLAYVRRALVNEYLSWRRKWARVVPRPQLSAATPAPDHAEAVARRSELAAELARQSARQRTALVAFLPRPTQRRDRAAARRLVVQEGHWDISVEVVPAFTTMT